MPNTPSFVEYALDLLSLLGPVQARPMFGGHGLYLQGTMFGIVDDDELFVRTDEASRPRFLSTNCRMWVYPGMEQTSYFRPPDGAHEDAEAMLPWARLGLEAALRLKAERDAAMRAKAERRAEREAKAAAAGRGPAAGKPGPAPKKKAPPRKGPAKRMGKSKAPARKPAPRKASAAKKRDIGKRPPGRGRGPR